MDTIAHLRRPRRGLQPTGFTLIEVMVVVAVIAILAAIAVPMYSDYIRRGQLQEAFTNLADYRVKLEQYYQDNKNYGTATCASAATAGSWNSFVPADHRYFQYACALTAAGQGFTVTATGAGSMTTGYDYTIDHNGSKKTTKYAGSEVNTSCWLSRGSSC